MTVPQTVRPSRHGTWERRKFLIVVKTYPNPSSTLQEVVCTAAIDERGDFARLFPIPFRNLKEAQRFKKWQWIEANVTKATDGRPESYKVEFDSIEVLGDPLPPGRKGWPERWRYVAHHLGPTMCSLRAQSSLTLGLIKPIDYELVIEDLKEKEWTAMQRQKLLGFQGMNLFGADKTRVRILEKLPVKISYKFRCQEASCNGHKMMFEDWEIGESWRKWSSGQYTDRAVLEAAVRETYVDEPRAKDNLYLFVGTIAGYPGSWVVIGHAQPLL